MKFPTLYHCDKKGKVREWNISTQGDMIITEYGERFGQSQRSEVKAKGKNIGRSNETTPEEQAIAEALSQWTKKRDTKYSETIEGAMLTTHLPMLAHSFEKHKKRLSYPVCVQPKLDGVRCLAFWVNGKVMLMSRGGKEYNVPHISEALSKILPEDFEFDGEIYCHGMPRQTINSLVKKNVKASDQLEYWVYDIPTIKSSTELPWDKRLRVLLTFHKFQSDGDKVRYLDTVFAGNETEMLMHHRTYVKAGYEGVIIRTLNGLYKYGYRSRDLLKYKEFLDAEFEIVGFDEGKGKFLGKIIWVCKTANGLTFQVVPQGTMEERAELYENASKYIGSMLTVKYQDLSIDGVPQFPVGLGIRMTEDISD